MGTIEFKIYKDKDLTVLTATGPVSGERILDELKLYYAGGVTSLILWDLRGVHETSVTSEDLRRVVQFTKSKMVQRKNGKTALVATSSVNYGLCRMFEILQDVSGASVEHGTFKTLEEAYAWLGTKPD